MRASGISISPSDHWMVPEAKTSAPLGAVYLTALTVPGWPGGGVVARIRPSSCSQLGLPADAGEVAVDESRLTPAGWRERYCACVGIASHSQPTNDDPMFVALPVARPELRQMRSPANSPPAFAAGTVSGKLRPSLSPTYITPQSWFSGMSGPTRPPLGAFGSPGGAPLSRNVVVEFSGWSSAVPWRPSAPSASSPVPCSPSGPQSLADTLPLAPEPEPSTVL